MSRILGIDPGINGAIALVDTQTETYEVFDMPRLDKEIDVYTLINTLIPSLGNIDGCCIELVHSMPLMSSQSMFSFGMHYGVVKCVPAILNCPVEFVSPQKWKRYFNIAGMERNKMKEASVLKAKQLFPNVEKQLLKTKDGRSEALLLAKYYLDNKK